MIKEFSNDNQTYVYDPTKLVLDQWQHGYEIFAFKQLQIRKPAAHIEQMVLGNGCEHLTKALRYLFVEKNTDGTLQKYDRARIGKTERFLQNLPGITIFKEMEEVMDNFLSIIEKQATALYLHSREEIDINVLLGQAMQTIASKGASGSSSNDNTNISTNPENLNED